MSEPVAESIPEPWRPSGRGSALEPMDAAIELLRGRLTELLPLYVVAAAPLAGAMLVTIDAVTAEDRAALGLAAAALTAALVWRWAWLAVLQGKVMAMLGAGAAGRDDDRAGGERVSLPASLPAIVAARLAAAMMMSWGMALLVLPFWGFFFGSFAAPALLARRARALTAIGHLWRWIAGAAGGLGRLAAAMVCLAVVVTAGGALLQLLLVHMVLPSLLGIDTTDLALTMQTLAWWLGYLGAAFLVFDLYWSVAAVNVFYDVQAKRLGSDLRWRLERLAG